MGPIPHPDKFFISQRINKKFVFSSVNAISVNVPGLEWLDLFLTVELKTPKPDTFFAGSFPDDDEEPPEPFMLFTISEGKTGMCLASEYNPTAVIQLTQARTKSFTREHMEKHIEKVVKKIGLSPRYQPTLSGG